MPRSDEAPCDSVGQEPSDSDASYPIDGSCPQRPSEAAPDAADAAV